MDVSRSRNTLHETLTTGEIKAMFAGFSLKKKSTKVDSRTLTNLYHAQYNLNFEKNYSRRPAPAHHTHKYTHALTGRKEEDWGNEAIGSAVSIRAPTQKKEQHTNIEFNMGYYIYIYEEQI